MRYSGSKSFWIELALGLEELARLVEHALRGELRDLELVEEEEVGRAVAGHEAREELVEVGAPDHLLDADGDVGVGDAEILDDAVEGDAVGTGQAVPEHELGLGARAAGLGDDGRVVLREGDRHRREEQESEGKLPEHVVPP